MRKRITRIAVVCVVAVVIGGLALAQQQQRGAQQGRGARQGVGQGAGGQRGMGMRDPAQMQAMMLERLQPQLGASDTQWNTLKPRLQKVMELNRQASSVGRFGGPGRGGMFGGPGRQGGPGQGRGQQQPAPQERVLTAVDKATQELQTLLGNQAATADQIKAKLTALRQATEKVKQDLAKAQTELKQGLSVKQEAMLVLMGYLN